MQVIIIFDGISTGIRNTQVKVAKRYSHSSNRGKLGLFYASRLTILATHYTRCQLIETKIKEKAQPNVTNTTRIE